MNKKVWDHVIIGKNTRDHVWDYQFIKRDDDSIYIIGFFETQIIIQPYKIRIWWISPNNVPEAIYVVDNDAIAFGENYYVNVFKLQRTFNIRYSAIQMIIVLNLILE